MENRLTERIYLSGTLGFESGFHVGTGEESNVTDNPLERDVMGDVMIPGTSLCGALRHHLCNYYKSKEKAVETYFGITGVKNISRVFIDDLYPVRGAMNTVIRDGVAIRRDYGTARDKGKYDYEISESGADMAFQMMVEFREGDVHEADMKQLLKTLIRDLETGRVRVGGNKTRGVGFCKLRGICAELARFPEDLKAVLIGKERGISISAKDISCQPVLTPDIHTLKITMACEVAEPLLIKDGMRSEAETFLEKRKLSGEEPRKETDAYFVKVVNARGDEVPVIPGASIKGIVRTRAEKIIRTLGRDACDPTERNNACNEEINAALKALSESKSKDSEDEARYDGIVDNSCCICRLFGNTFLASRIFFSDSDIRDGAVKKFDGVAINRFTSGPVDAALFDMMPLVKGHFTIRMEAVDISAEETALLMFVLRDFKTGAIPLSIGFGKNKGYGIPHVNSVTVNDEDFEQFIKKNSGIFESWKNLWKKS